MKAQQELVHYIGQKIGLPELVLDDERQATVTFDDLITVTFLAEEDGLTVVSYVADYDPDSEAIGKHLLQLNYLPTALGGAKLAVDPKSDSVILTNTWDAALTDGERFFAELEMFVNAVQAIQGEITRLSQSNDPDAEAKPEAINTSPLMMYGRMA
jgi:hypothetical protein